eukprot:2095069-Rhodomonas_salina.2
MRLPTTWTLLCWHSLVGLLNEPGVPPGPTVRGPLKAPFPGRLNEPAMPPGPTVIERRYWPSSGTSAYCMASIRCGDERRFTTQSAQTTAEAISPAAASRLCRYLAIAE